MKDTLEEITVTCCRIMRRNQDAQKISSVSHITIKGDLAHCMETGACIDYR